MSAPGDRLVPGRAGVGDLRYLADFLRGYVKVGATHIIVRFVGDPDRQLEIVAGFRAQLDG